MEFDFSSMTAEEIEARAAAIAEEVNNEGADLEALRDEARAINAEREQRAAEEQRREIREQVAAGSGTVIRHLQEERNMPEVIYTAASPEYRTAWLKNLAVRQSDGFRLFGDLNEEERAAFTHTTSNSGAVVPTNVLNRIVDLVESMSPMYADAVKTAMTQGFAVPRRKSISAGDAKSVAEGAANDDEQNVFDQVPLDGVEIKKHIVLTRKMQFKSIDAFENWVVQELAARIGVAKDVVIMARMDGTAPNGGSAVAAAKMDTANVKTNVTKDDAGIRGVMSLLKGTGRRVIYANNNTIWNVLAGLENANGQKLFIPGTQSDPVTQGNIYGATVRLDENLADNVIYGVVVGQLIANDFDELFVFPTLESKTANTIITGYSLFDAALLNPKGAFKATFATT